MAFSRRKTLEYLEKRLDDDAKRAEEMLDNIDEARTTLGTLIMDNTPLVYRVAIYSAWSSEGELDHERTYTGTLGRAIESAMMDYCKKNGRVFKGKPREYAKDGESKVWNRYDVQGSVHVAVILAPGIHISLPKAAFESIEKKLKGTAS
jgi:hypothetical protein